jgi:hypothetical protein
MRPTTNDWFEAPKVEKPKVSAIKGTYIERCLNIDNEYQERWPNNNLQIRNLADLSDPKGMFEAIVSFWFPSKEEMTYKSEFYLTGGSISGDRVARRFHKARLTNCLEEEYKEYKIYNEEFGWAGKVDLILDVNKLMYFGQKTVKGDPPKEPLWRVFEVKETDSERHKEWADINKIPLKYLGQLNTYIYELVSKDIVKETLGHFLILDRSNPKAFRVVDYPYNSEMLDSFKYNAEKFWNHIRNKTVPNGFELSILEIEEAIETQKATGRRFNKLSEI